MIGFRATEKTTVLFRIPPEVDSETKFQEQAMKQMVMERWDRKRKEQIKVFSRQVPLWAPSLLPPRSYIKHAQGCPIWRAKGCFVYLVCIGWELLLACVSRLLFSTYCFKKMKEIHSSWKLCTEKRVRRSGRYTSQVWCYYNHSAEMQIKRMRERKEGLTLVTGYRQSPSSGLLI